jgi:hypothetical protein
MERIDKCKLAKERGFRYDPETGNIYGIKKRSPLKCKTSQGYLMIRVQQEPRIEILGHHFAWYMSGKDMEFDMLDHKDENKMNNRISNLRITNYTENNRNVFTTAKGYCWDKNTNKWLVTIGVKYKQIYIGRYNTEQEAREAYLKAKKKYHNG